MRSFAHRFRSLALELGGLMIKVGQFMSSRVDVLPPEFAKELEALQDEVPPVPFSAVRELAEAELGGPLERYFHSVQEQPLAAASLGQVHRAQLREYLAADVGFSDVVLKVQRPGIDDVVRTDLAALERIAGWLAGVRVVASRVNTRLLVQEFAKISLEEVDYTHEASNAERFAEDFADDPRVRVPQVVWEKSSNKVLTLEDVSGIKISDVEALRDADIDPAEVAKVFTAVMFEQLFTTGFFHADPHPGNLFVLPSATGWQITFIDFGMMGQVPEQTRDGLRKLLIAAAAQNSAGMVDGLDSLGVLMPHADRAELQRAVSAVFARFAGMAISDLQKVDPRELQEFAREFGDLLRTMPFQLPEDFLFIMRAASLVSGVSTTLDPNFNIWESMDPYAQRLLREQGKNVLRDAGGQVVDVARLTLALPRRVDALLNQLEAGKFSVNTPSVDKSLAVVLRIVRGAVAAIVFFALMLAGAILYPTNSGLSVTFFIVSVVPLGLAVSWSRRR